MTRLNIAPASKGMWHHHYDPTSICSIDFAELIPMLSVETVPTDKWKKVSFDGTLRVTPQVFPPYGKMYLKNASFFVPLHQITEQADAIQMHQKFYKGKLCITPHFFTNTLVSFLRQSTSFSSIVYSLDDPTSPPPVSAFDFVILSKLPTLKYNYCKLTRLGRRYYKILKMLGYDFPSYSYSSGISYDDAFASGQIFLNAYNLLAYAKVYVDYFLSGVAYNTNPLVRLLHSIHDCESFYDDTSTLCYDDTDGLITPHGLKLIFDNIFLPHEQSMYTEAWNSPNSPNGLLPSIDQGTNSSINQNGLISPYVLSSPFNTTTVNVETSQFDSFLRQRLNNSNQNLSFLNALGVRFLLATDKLVRRWNLGGSKSVQKLYAFFGIKSDDFNSHFVHKLHEDASLIKFYPVMSNADTVNGSDGKPLGDYSGMGLLGSLKGQFDYECNDYGILIHVAWLQVKPILLRGIHPSNLRESSYDWWCADYDGVALRAIPNEEISINRFSNSSESAGFGAKQIYGYTNIYDDYRELRDNVAGDFINEYMKDFLFCRDLSVIREAQNTPLHPQNNIIQYYDNGSNPDMSDPFMLKSSNGDRLSLQLDYDIDVVRPIKNESASFDLGEGDVEINKNGILMN